MARSSKGRGKLNRRVEILRAARKLMNARGLSGVTTRQIAQEVGCSEGALYVHFDGRLELLLTMLEESLPDMLRPLQTLSESVGRGSPREIWCKRWSEFTGFTGTLSRVRQVFLPSPNSSPRIAAFLDARTRGPISR